MREDFTDVYDRYFSRVSGYVRCRVNSRAEADEVTSRVFERALRGFGTYRPERGDLEIWLFAVARNAVRDHFRSWWRRSTFSLEEAGAWPAREPGAQESLEAQEDRRLLLAALDGLPERERDILGLKFQARLTNRQIAEVLKIGESHVGVLVYRAVRKLKAELSPVKEVS